MTRPILLSPLLMAVALISPPLARAIPLDCPWEIVRTASPERPADDARWSAASVPEFLNFKADLPFAWYRTRFATPEDSIGKQLFLKFHGVQYSAKVVVNGREVGGYVGGGEPFEMEITDAVRKGGSNELLVRAGDIRAVIDGELDASKVKRGERLVEHLSDAIMHPVGSKYSAFGIWEPVELVVRDRLYLDDVFIRTSVRKKEIAVDFTIRNLTDKPQSAVLSAITEGFDLGKTTVEVPAKGEKTVTLTKPWPDAKLWSPKEPHLYTLDIALTQDGKTLEHRRERFGFREFWIEGTRFVLNGIPMTFLGTSKHPSGTLAKELSKDSAFDLYRRIRTANCNAIRLHANLWPKHWFDAADEDGMPLILESGLWCFSKQYALSKDAFWKNYDRHLRGMSKKYRNHPAIMMISLENEILHCGGARYYRDCEARLADAGRKFKRLDATRPIMYDGDEDPGGVADVINLHYPINFKKDTLWPQVCWWLDEGKEVAGWPRKFWKWDRKKPLYMGEFLHLQQFRTVEPYSLLLGDGAFADIELLIKSKGSQSLDFRWVMGMCKAKAWSMQIPAYRAQGVSGMCPWVVTESGPFPVDDYRENPRFFAVKRGYQPVTVFERDCESEFFADQAVRRRFDVFNDSDRSRTLTLRWSVSVQKVPPEPLHEERTTVTLPPAGHKVIEKTLDLGQLLKTSSHETRDELNREGSIALNSIYRLLDEKGETITLGYEDSVRIEKRDLDWGNLPSGKGVGLLEKESGVLGTFLKRHRVRFRRVNALSDLRDLEVVVIAPGVLAQQDLANQKTPSVGDTDSPAESIKRFTAQGGRVLVLRQEPFPLGLFPVETINSPANRTFFRYVTQDALNVFESLDAWLGSSADIGPMAMSVFGIPSCGGTWPLCRTGGPTGLDRAPALGCFVGQGLLVFSQHRIVQNISKTPAAVRLLRQLFELCCDEHPMPSSIRSAEPDGSPVRPAVVQQNLPLTRRLAEVGAVFDDLSGRLSSSNLQQYPLLIAEADADEVTANLAAIKAYVTGGGRLILHGPMERHLKDLQPLFPEPIRLRRYGGPVCLHPAHMVSAIDPPLHWITNCDLHWYADRKGLAWRTRTLPAEDICPWVVIPGKPEEGVQPTEIASEAMKPVSGRSTFRNDHVAMNMTGAVACEFTLPKRVRKKYLLSVVARGTPAKGQWPRLAVRINDKPAGTLTIDDTDWCERPLLLDLEGEQRVELAFINDAWDPETKEDRNVYIQAVRCTPWHCHGGTSWFDVNGLMIYRVGQGLLFLDQINWTAPKNPSVKADRYLSLFLANLGVAFENPLGVLSIPGAEFETVGKEVSRGGSSGIRHMWANGKVQKKIRFGSDGTYRFSIRASGTPLEGVYPEFRLWIDDKAVETFRLEDEKPATLRGYVPVKAGDHRVGIEFVNDKSSETEDRNLRVYEVRVAKE